MADDNLVQRTAIGGLGALVSGLVPPAAPAVAVVSPLLERFVGDADRRLHIAMLEAEKASGWSAAKIADGLDDEEGRRLTAQAAEAAAMTTDRHLLRALGLSLAAAAMDPTQVDREVLLVAAIRAVEPSHMRLLRVLAMTHKKRVDDQSEPREVAYWVLSELADVSPELDVATANVLIGPPVNVGLVAPGSGFGSLTYRVTDLGHLLLERATEAATGDV